MSKFSLYTSYISYRRNVTNTHRLYFSTIFDFTVNNDDDFFDGSSTMILSEISETLRHEFGRLIGGEMQRS